MEGNVATIEEAKIRKISDIWSRKPRGLRFNDTDALIVTAKTPSGERIRETFYFCLKPDGTFNVNTISRDGSHRRRLRLARFLRHYHFTDEVAGYNLKEDVKNWKGKEVSFEKVGDNNLLYVP